MTIAEPVAAAAALIAQPDLAAFVAQLVSAVSGSDYAQLQSQMSDPIAVDAWRSE